MGSVRKRRLKEGVYCHCVDDWAVLVAPLIWGADGLVGQTYEVVYARREKADDVTGRALPCGDVIGEDIHASGQPLERDVLDKLEDLTVEESNRLFDALQDWERQLAQFDLDDLRCDNDNFAS
ncbi:hypothetical protein [uncultured Tateyamaria sp.]|uniref:hypothetical protein n=1 Tax=uncultured Tateyamaria sp. TaxID=455651 RepID=UPI002623B7B8|nr:hypothetical protein [uncultured Tateyamaria sp.]